MPLLSLISIAHLVLLLLSSVSYKIFCRTSLRSPYDLALMGDFNIRIDSSSSEAGRLSGILDSFDLHQYIDFPTHIHGHSLDLMICFPGYSVLSVLVSDLISDYFSVVANLQIPTQS